MSITLSRAAYWWPTAIGSVLVLPLIPSIIVIVVGFIFPDTVPWSIANSGLVAGAILSVFSFAFLLRYRSWPNVLRGLALAIIALVMSVFSRVEFFTSQECVTQQGRYIDLQRQYREVQAARGQTCG